jgi:hypothetical protein
MNEWWQSAPISRLQDLSHIIYLSFPGGLLGLHITYFNLHFLVRDPATAYSCYPTRV